MSYTINVARGHKEIRRWGEPIEVYSYHHYFRVNTEHCRKADWNDTNNLDDMVAELRSLYPSPKFKVSVYENKSHSEEIEVPEENIEPRDLPVTVTKVKSGGKR